MRRALKVSAWAAGSVAALAVLLLAALFVAGNTQAGRSMIERVTLKLTGGYVKLSGLGGSFPAHLTLERLELIDRGGVWLTADRLSVSWSPWALIERRIAVEEAQAARVDMERTPLGEPSSGGGPPWIPHIDVAQFSVGEVNLGAQLAGRPATLTVRGGGRLHALDDALADVVARRIDGDGKYTVHFRLDPNRMDGTLEVHEPASGPLENILGVPGLGALSANLAVNGPRVAEQIDLALNAGDLAARAHGTVDLRKFSADLSYSLEAPAVSPRPDLRWQRLALKGGWRGAFTDPEAEGHLEVEKLLLPGGTEISALHADLAGGSGVITLKGLIDGLRIPGAAPSLLEKDPLKIDAAWRVKEAARPLRMTAAHRLFSLEVNAVTAGDLSATLDLKLPSVAPFAALAGQDVRGDAAIKAQIRRSGSGLALDLDAGAGISGGTAAWIGIVGDRLALKASGAISDDAFSIDRLQLAGRALALTASGSATRAAGAGAGTKAGSVAGAGGAASLIKDLKARWDLRLADLSILGSQLSGTMQASGTLSGTPAALGADADLRSTLSIRGSPAGTVIVELQARGLPSAPSATVKAHGTVDDSPLDLEAVLGRRAHKGLKADIRRADWKSVHLSGTWQMESSLADSRGKLELKVGELGDFDHLLGSTLKGALDGSAVFTPQGAQTHAQFQLNGTDLVAGPFSGAVHLTGEGDTKSVAAELSVESPNLRGAPAKLTAGAVVNLGADEVRVVSAAADYRGQQLKLLAPAKASYKSGFSIEELKLGMQDAVLQVQGAIAPELDLHASLSHVDPKLMNAFLSDIVLAGTIDGRVDLRGSLAAPTGSVRLHAGGVRFSTDEALGLPPIDLNAGAELAGDSASLDVRLNAGSTPLLTAKGSVPYRAAGGSYDLKVGGKLDVGVFNPLFEAHGMHVGGKLEVDATVGGDLNEPQIRGAITLAQGNIRDYVRGLNLTRISGEVDGSEGTLQLKSFNASAGSGTIGMTGSIGVLQPGIPIDIKVTAANAQPIASNILTANLNADIHISGKAREQLSIAGSIHLNRAVIGIPDSLPPEVAVLDVRRRGKPAQAAAKQRVIALDVSINAPRQVLVQGRGLDAELGGDLQISGTSSAPQVTGGFQLQRGSFTIGSSKLNLVTPSQIGFDGTGLKKKIDPSLDFTATGNGVTLHITGYADAPKFDFTGAPGQSPDEIMAQLLFGESPSQLSALQLAEVGAALATLSGVGGSGGSPLTKLQRSLGLDRLSVGAGTTTTATGATENSGAAIQAGRYVSKRVYIEGKQSTTGQSQVEVDVDLTKHLKLQTRLGNGTAIQGTTPDTDPGSSVGFSYQFEY